MSGLPWPPGPVNRPGSQNGHRPAHLAAPVDLSLPYQPPSLPAGGENGHGRHAAAAADLPPVRSLSETELPGSDIARRPEPAALSDTRLLAAVPEILTTIADMLPDRAERPEVMPLIMHAVRVCIKHQCRLGVSLPNAADV